MNKHQRFENSEQFFACPHCGQALGLYQNSLRCVKNHTFDIARQGYVNLAPQAKVSAAYHQSTFENRQTFLEKGYYDHLYQALERQLTDRDLSSVLDVGCGEGFYARTLAQHTGLEILAFDLSKSSILLAARRDTTKSVKWFVGDLTALPLQSQSVDALLDIFSPAHYHEFARVLKKGGYVFKMVPGPNHLKELRHLAKEQLRKSDYDNREIVDYFKSNVADVSEQLLSKTLSICTEDVQILADMTPLFFQVDQSCLDFSQIQEITIEGLLLVGRMN